MPVMVYPRKQVLNTFNRHLSVDKPKKHKVSDDTKKLVKTFCERNSIHAINNFLRESSGIYERITWFLVLTMTIIGLIYVSFILSRRYYEGTFQTVVASTTYPVHSIVFPATTICNSNRLNWNRIKGAKNKFLPGEKDRKKLELFEQFIANFNGMSFGKFDVFENVAYQNLSILNEINITSVIEFLTWTCEEMFDHCKWREEHFNCCEEFKRQRSELGLCYAFNGLQTEESKKRKELDKYYPFHNSYYGPKSALEVRVFIRPKDHVSNNTFNNGLFVMLAEPPVWYKEPFFIPWNTETSIEIDPVIYFFDNDTKTISSSLRKCVFDDERNSVDFKSLPGHVYMIENCYSQCRQEHLMRYCNCTLDLLFPTGDYLTCKASDFQCIYEHRDFFRYTKREGEEKYVFNRHVGMSCKCFRNCVSLNYITEVRPSYLPANVFTNSSYVDLDIHYRFDSIVLYRTSLVFGWVDLVVSFGGIAGLFLGCSIISAVEIFYFLCFDIPAFIYRRLKKRWSHRRVVNQQQRWAEEYRPKAVRTYNQRIFHVDEQIYK